MQRNENAPPRERTWDQTSIARLLADIRAPEPAAASAARAIWNGLAKPLGSLGLLEEAVVRVAALTGSADVRLSPRTLLVFCADHGVVARGVTQCGSDVTAHVANALAMGESTVCHMARQADCRVVPVDVGILEESPLLPGVLSRRVRNGTADMTRGPAMTLDECHAALLVGADAARSAAAGGARLIAVGEMGIGNTTAASAVAAVLLDLPENRVTGRGAGLSDAGMARKIAAICEAIQVNAPDGKNPLDVLSKVGGLEIAAMCGAFLGAAACRIPALIDGMASALAALCAVRLCPRAGAALLASHVSPEPAGALLLEALGCAPLITAGLRLGEGSGAVAAMPLLDMALAVYRSGHTFYKLGIPPYVDQT